MTVLLVALALIFPPDPPRHHPPQSGKRHACIAFNVCFIPQQHKPPS